jgi:hypothetical protein
MFLFFSSRYYYMSHWGKDHILSCVYSLGAKSGKFVAKVADMYRLNNVSLCIEIWYFSYLPNNNCLKSAQRWLEKRASYHKELLAFLQLRHLTNKLQISCHGSYIFFKLGMILEYYKRNFLSEHK